MNDDERRELVAVLRGVDEARVFNRLAGLIDDLCNELALRDRRCRMLWDAVHCNYICDNCGAWVRPDASRDMGGVRLEYCPSCGRKVEDDARR